MEEEVLSEITEYCRTCLCNTKCTEENCVLYRIEQIILGVDSSEDSN